MLSCAGADGAGGEEGVHERPGLDAGGHRGAAVRVGFTIIELVAVIVVLGLVGTVTSRNRLISQINNAGGTAPMVGTTW